MAPKRTRTARVVSRRLLGLLVGLLLRMLLRMLLGLLLGPLVGLLMGLLLGLPLGLLLGLMLKLVLGLLGCTTHVPVMCQGRFCDTVTKMTLNLVIKKWRVAIHPWLLSCRCRKSIL